MPSILVVEDDENLNRGITFSLKKSGYEVFSAESVKKAKRIANDNNVDVTICDVNLPDGNGLEFVRWMRCNYNTYIICLTALDRRWIRSWDMKQGQMIILQSRLVFRYFF